MPIILTLLLLVGCGAEIYAYPYKNNRTFNPHRDYFEQVTGYNTDHIPIMFGALDGDLAQCRYVEVPTKYGSIRLYRRIVVDIGSWFDLSPTWQLALIAHELIHCRLGRDHEHIKTEVHFWIMDESLPTHLALSEELLEKQLSYYRKNR